jgi:L-glutamine-phosphate cytidylyltransferase
MELIILAAGKGSRLPERFRKTPKCLVKINSKELIYHNENFIKKFRTKYVVCGYKKEILKKKIKNLKCNVISNDQYKKTNMVYSLYLVRKKIKQDVVIMYGDIFFDENIYKLLKPKKNILPLNRNWLSNWKNRMGMKKALIDAEDVKIKKNIVTEIGKPINKSNLPQFQFMGLIKLKEKTFKNMMLFFKKLNNDRIDMTSFLNLCIKEKILKIEMISSNKYWFEIDTINDHKYAEKQLKKW